MGEKETVIENLSFEESLGELEDIVRTLEEGGQELDNAIKNYERGTALKKHCESKLKEAKLKVEKIVLTENGSLKAEFT